MRVSQHAHQPVSQSELRPCREQSCSVADMTFLWRFLLSVAAAVLPTISSTAAELLSDLTCNVTRLPDGLFVYQLSRPPSSSRCITCWENQSATVFAHDSDFSSLLVHNLTNSSIVLKDCEDYMHFTKNCGGVFEEAHCRVNCSLFLDPQIAESPAVTVLLSILVPLVVISVVVLLFQKCKNRRFVLSPCTPYTPASTSIELPQQHPNLGESD